MKSCWHKIKTKEELMALPNFEKDCEVHLIVALGVLTFGVLKLPKIVKLVENKNVKWYTTTHPELRWYFTKD